MTGRRHVFIMGTRGYHQYYGKWEKVVSHLIRQFDDGDTRFYVTHMTHQYHEAGKKIIDGVEYLNIHAPQGVLALTVYSMVSLLHALHLVRRHGLQNVIFYVLGTAGGPVYFAIKLLLMKLGIHLVVNPGGMAPKAGQGPLRRLLGRVSLSTMMEACDWVICDSRSLQKRLLKKYRFLRGKSTYIPYGATRMEPDEGFLADFRRENQLEGPYFLCAASFVEENNLELLFREYLAYEGQAALVLLTTPDYRQSPLYGRLNRQFGLEGHARIRIFGDIYEEKKLDTLRLHCEAYIHPSQRDSTDPNLLEAMANAPVVLAYHCPFNLEAALTGGLYFGAENGGLRNMLRLVEQLDEASRQEIAAAAQERIDSIYNWQLTADWTRRVFDYLTYEEEARAGEELPTLL